MWGTPLRPLRGFFCLLFFYGSLAAAVAQEDPVQAAREGLVLIPQGNSARLELPGGEALQVSLPQGAEVSSLAAVDNGWVAAGSFPDAAGRQRLFLLTGDDKGSRSLPEPPGQPPQIPQQRRAPVLLVDGGRLAGLAWLEGDGLRTLAVRAAAWNGRRWQAAQWVSHPGPGSQLALTGAVLADGSWLLAWSAFDGTGYQLRMARFERGEWRDEHAAGPSGSLYPAFLGGPDRPRLLYLEAAAKSWSVLDFDGTGRVQAKASLASPSLSRPVVDSVGDGVRLRWPAEKRQGTAPLKTLERVP